MEYIDKVQLQLDGSTSSVVRIEPTLYGVCRSDSAAVNKVVTISDFELVTGVTIHVKFVYSNTAANPTLNVSGTGAKPILQYGVSPAGTSSETDGWYNGAIVQLTYDGDNWIRDQGFNTNTNTHYTTHLYSGTGRTAQNTTVSASRNEVKLFVTDNNTINTNSAVTLVGSGTTTVSSTNGIITIHSTGAESGSIIHDDFDDSELLKLDGSRTMEGTLVAQGNQYADSYSGALDMNDSNIFGVHSIFTSAIGTDSLNGFHFYRDISHVDTLWVNHGDILFSPNRELGVGVLKSDSQKIGRFINTPVTNNIVVASGEGGGLRTATPTELRSILSLSSALHFIGITTTDLFDGSQMGTIRVDGEDVDAYAGDIVIDRNNSTEYLWTGEHWEVLGPDSSFKPLQAPYDSGQESVTNRWISRIQQNQAGVITTNFTSLDTSGLWSGVAMSSYSLQSRGAQVAEQDADAPSVQGVSMTEADNNGYPTTNGNILTMYGNGSTQLLMGYAREGVAHVNIYARNKAPSDSAIWSPWYTLLDGTNYTDFTVTKTGVGAEGTWNITAQHAIYDGIEENLPIYQKYALKSHDHGLITDDGRIKNNYSAGCVYVDDNGIIRVDSFKNNSPEAASNELGPTCNQFIKFVAQDATGRVTMSRATLNTEGKWNGLAGRAEELEYPQEIYVDLSTTRDPIFDHILFNGKPYTPESPGYPIQVSGILPMEHGGTGVDQLQPNRILYVKLPSDAFDPYIISDGNAERAENDENEYGHFINNQKIAVNSTTQPGNTFLVNGTSDYYGNILIHRLNTEESNDSTNILFPDVAQSTSIQDNSRGISWMSSGGGTGQLFFSYTSTGTDVMYLNMLHNNSARISFRNQDTEVLGLNGIQIDAKKNIVIAKDSISVQRSADSSPVITNNATRAMKARDIALLKTTSYIRYDTIWSMKTMAGDWSQSVEGDNLYWTFISDTAYNGIGTTVTARMTLTPNGELLVPVFQVNQKLSIYNTGDYHWELTTGVSGSGNDADRTYLHVKDSYDNILQTLYGFGNRFQMQTLRITDDLQIVTDTGNPSRLRLVYGNYGAFVENDSNTTDGGRMSFRFTRAGYPYENPVELRPLSIYAENGLVHVQKVMSIYDNTEADSAKLWINSAPQHATRSHGDYLEVVSNYSDNDHWAVALKNLNTANNNGTGIKLAGGALTNASLWSGIHSYTFVLNSTTQMALDFYASAGYRMRLTHQALLPASNQTYNLGSTSVRWNKLYIGTANTHGTSKKFIYWNDGEPVATTETIGSDVKPIYMDQGTIKATNKTLGGQSKFIYMNAGVLSECSNSIGSTTKPIYMSAGTIQVMTGTVGGGEQPVWFNAGEITSTTYALKATLNNGTANTLPYYSAARAISSSNIQTNGSNLTANISTFNDNKAYIRITSNSKTFGLFLGSNGYDRGLYDWTQNKWVVYADDTNIYLNGNANTATALATARTLWGNSFDGTSNISGTISLDNGADIHFNPTSADDAGDIVWAYANGNEKMRIWTDNNYTQKSGPNFRLYNSGGSQLYSGTLVLGDGTGASGTWGIHITGNAGGSSSSCTGNAASATVLQTARSLWGNSFNGSGDISGTILIPTTASAATASQPTALSYGRLQAYGTLCINANTDNSGTEYVVLTAGKGLSSTGSDGLEVGSSTLKFLGTEVVRNSGTWDISINGTATSAGSADSATSAGRLSSTGYGTTCLTYYQTSETFDGNSGWCHYIIGNHGVGSSYFHYTLALPFWEAPKYKRQTGSINDVTSWYTILSTENKDSYTYPPASHTHDMSNITWANGSNLSCTGGGEWSIDMNGDGYWHVWSTTQGGSCLQCYNNDRHSWAYKMYGAVWNDYAEYRKGEVDIEPGRVVQEGKDRMFLCNERLHPGCKVVSDTYGMAIGKSKIYNTPIAVSGRVLAFPYRDREEYTLGAAVCSAPNGTIDIMTRDEIMMYPDRIIGTVSEIPNYDVWYAGGVNERDGGTDPIEVKGRIWIYVR